MGRAWVVRLALVLVTLSVVRAEEPPRTARIEQTAGQADAIRQRTLAVARRLTRLYPEDFDAWRILGFAYSSQGQMAKAAECWRQCRRLSPDRADVHDRLARFHFSREQYEQALSLWRRAASLDTRLPGVHRQIGQVLLKLDRPEQAVRACREQLRITPGDATAHFLLGEAFFAQQQLQSALDSYRQAVRKRADYTEAYYGLIKTAARLGDEQTVRWASERFAALEAAADRADAVHRQQRDDLGLMRHHLAVVYRDTGRLLARRGQIEHARRAWRLAAQTDRTETEAVRLLAQSYGHEADAAEAIAWYAELLRRDPDHASPYHERIGSLYASSGDVAAAEKHFQEALDASPDSPSAHRSLAKLYLNSKQNKQRALQLAYRATELAPEAESLFVLGWALAENDRVELARRALQQAMKLDPTNQVYGRLYAQLSSSSKR